MHDRSTLTAAAWASVVRLVTAARRRQRFWVEAGLSALSGGLFVLTLFVPDWIEAVFRVNPDGHSGAIEWVITAGLLVVSVVVGLLARSEWRKLRPDFEAARR
jgi:hypothetical protein